MIEAPFPENESERLKALRQYQILDTAPEKIFDEITSLAAHITGTPIALISLIDETRQWFKSHYGTDSTQTDRKVAFCAHAIHQDDVMSIRDAKKDKRFFNNPLVTGDPFIRFYAGASLKSEGGHNIGVLCVIDHKPRDLDEKQIECLRILSHQVISQLEIRRTSQLLADALKKVKVLDGLIPICANCKKIRDDKGYWDLVEDYISTRTDAQFTHGICPDCLQKHYSISGDPKAPS